MVYTNFTYIELVEPRMKYVEPLGYEVTEEKVEGYVEVIVKSARDEEFNRFGTFEEMMQMTNQS